MGKQISVINCDYSDKLGPAETSCSRINFRLPFKFSSRCRFEPKKSFSHMPNIKVFLNYFGEPGPSGVDAFQTRYRKRNCPNKNNRPTNKNSLRCVWTTVSPRTQGQAALGRTVGQRIGVTWTQCVFSAAYSYRTSKICNFNWNYNVNRDDRQWVLQTPPPPQPAP
jgi:hypothetical protein